MIRRVIALSIVAVLAVASPATAGVDDLVVTSSVCCLTADGAGPDSLTYSAYNAGVEPIVGVEIPINVPEGLVAVPDVTVWVIDELAPGQSIDLTMTLSPAVAVLGRTLETSVVKMTASATDDVSRRLLPAWLQVR